MNNYTVYHCHTWLSNPTTTMDSVTGYKAYVDKAVDCNMKAIAFSEHGNMFEYLHKKEYVESNGLKYIHAVEAYVTKTLKEKVRDNYHVVLIAKNFEGFKELNYLMSDKVANNREDGHFYYTPRITYEELKSTSDNIIITTACLGGILNSGDAELEKDFIGFLKQNKHRAFLEVQHHDVDDQIEYNIKLLDISLENDIRLIAGTDTHSLDVEHAEGRVILQKAKNTHFPTEDGWDMTFKSYEDLVQSYYEQGSIPEDKYLEAIENTNVIADMIEEYSFDKSHKYPKLYEDSEKVFKQKIWEGIKSKNIEIDEDKKSRIIHEMNTMIENGSVDYMLLEEDYKAYCRRNNIPYGYGRGSVSGSYIAYLMNITEMDSIKHNLIFERFMNPERVSLCDVDTDLPPSKRDVVKDYIYNKEGLYCADIITFNTIALKGAIRDVGRALEIPLIEVDRISKGIDDNEAKFRKEYPELFKYADLLNGVVVSTGTHPAGVVVSPIPLEDIVGTCTLSTTKYPVTLLNMKEIDSLNFVKLDLLGLDNVEIIHETCELAGIEPPTPDNIDTNDEDVWNSIKESALGVFQWESPSAWSYYRELFSENTIEKIKKQNPNFNYIDLFSMGNGAIRPAGESYRNALAKGDFKDNGHEVLDEFLKPTLGYLVFQEQIIEFLNKFCGFSMGEADIVRRGFSKKSGTEQFIPKIKEGFISTMSYKYGVSEEKSENLIESFINVINDASDYLFSLNHSQSYSYIGYTCAWLRHYYPLEFMTSLLNVSRDNSVKTTKGFEYIRQFTDIKVKPIRFRYSKSDYAMDKENNAIYKGIASIKYLSAELGNELYDLRDGEYKSFIDLLKAIKTRTSCNSKQLDILIKLDYFSEFGKSGKLLKIVEMYEHIGKKNIKKTTVEKLPFTEEQIKKYADRETEKTYMEMNMAGLIHDVTKDIPDEDISIKDKIDFQLEYLGYVDLGLGVDPKNCYVTSVDTKFNPKITVLSLGDGQEVKFKMTKDYYSITNLKVGDIIYVHDAKKKQASRPDGTFKKNGKPNFEKIPGVFDYYISNCEKITAEEIYKDRSGD